MRKTESDKEAVKALIEEKAIKVFSIKGFHSSTMQDIADEVGISKGPLYYHFKNKNELFNHIAEILIIDQIAEYKKIFCNEDLIFTKISNDLIFCTESLTTYKNQFFVNIMGIDFDPLLEPAKNQYIEFAKWLYQLKLENVEKAIEKGELKKSTNAKNVVNLMFSYYYGISQIMQQGIQNEIFKLGKTEMNELTSTWIAALKKEFHND